MRVSPIRRLWPALHSRPDLIQVTDDDYASYREINAFMARALLRFTGPDAVFWVQDYHFLPLGAEMRRLHIGRPDRLFFAHAVGRPPHDGGGAASCRSRQAMLAYDLIGFQTDEDRQNFEDYLQYELGVHVVDGTVTSARGMTQLATFPIGIDVDEFSDRATKATTRADVARLRASLQGAKLVLGVDRLDYSKGLANRMRAFDRMLEMEPRAKAHSVDVAGGGADPRQHPRLSRAEGRARCLWSARSTAVTARSTGPPSATSTRASRS